jgi:hypothetical protein
MSKNIQFNFSLNLFYNSFLFDLIFNLIAQKVPHKKDFKYFSFQSKIILLILPSKSIN